MSKEKDESGLDKVDLSPEPITAVTIHVKQNGFVVTTKEDDLIASSLEDAFNEVRRILKEEHGSSK